MGERREAHVDVGSWGLAAESTLKVELDRASPKVYVTPETFNEPTSTPSIDRPTRRLPSYTFERWPIA